MCKISHHIFLYTYGTIYNKILRLLFHFLDRSVFNQALQDTNFFTTFPQASFYINAFILTQSIKIFNYFF
jgi:hypothetical protein